MTFDDEQTRRDAGQGPADQSAAESSDAPPEGERRRGVGGTIAAAGAAGTGLGAGAAAGVVGADEALEHLRDREDADAEGVDPGDDNAAHERIAAAEEAARAVSFDVFDSRVGGTLAELPTGVAEAATIIGDALPPLPGAQDGEQPDPDIGGRPPADGEAPEPGGPPSIGQPRQESTDEGEEPAAEPGIDASEGDDDAPGASEFPDAPDFPDAPGEPSFPGPPPGEPSGPAPPAGDPSIEGSGEDDGIIDEGPAPEFPDAPDEDVPSSPAPGDSEDPGVSEAPSGEPSDDVVSEGPAPGESAGPSEPGGPAEPGEPGTDGPAPPDSPDESTAPGTSDEPAPPVSGEPDEPSTSSPPDDVPGSEPPSGQPDEPDIPPPSSGSEEPSSPSGPGGGPVPVGPGDDSGSPDQTVSYPYVYAWDEYGHWVDVAMQSDDGDAYYLRYYDDGTVFYQNEHGQYVEVEGDHLPRLLYVDDDGKAYFSKVQQHDTAYFSLDTHGEIDWVDYEDVPGYEDQPHDDEYEYPRVLEYHYGDEGWALIELEGGQQVKYYEDGGAYFVDEHGNETPASGYQIPTLLHVDHDGDAYFRVYVEAEGGYRYYMIDEDGGVEYVSPDDIPGYDYEEPVDEYTYPRTTQWDADEGWAISEVEEGLYIKFYENGTAYFVDEHGNETPGPQINATLLYVDHEGRAYFREGDEGNYFYYMHDSHGGYQELGPEDIPGYDYQPPEDGYDYPRVVEYYDGDVDWALVEDENGQLIKYYADGSAYHVDADGNETAYMNPEALVAVDEYGNAYFHRTALGADNQYYKLDAEGGIEYIDPHDIPGYDVPDDYQEPEYPRVIEWNADAGWAIVTDGEGHYARYYEDGHNEIVDEHGNLAQPNGADLALGRLLYVDEYGNAYFEGYDDDGNPVYFEVDYDGGIEYVDPQDIPGYDQNGEPVEGGYDTALAEHFGPYLGFEHPYNLYGEPDPPGDNQAPNVYLFGGGRAMVVLNEDGSETITWYSEGGYADGYIEYKATASWYDADTLAIETHANPLDLMVTYGILPVDGTPVYDPYHPDAPWGEPDSVTILEDRVIAIWETDEGQIRSEWDRLSGYREVRYPDGLVITGDGSDAWEYQIPDDWEAPVYDELDGYLPEGTPDYFGDPMWTNPETDPRFEFQYEGYPDGEDGPVTRTYHADVDGDGTADYVAVVVENPNGTYYIDYGYPNGDWQARAEVLGNNLGNYAGYQISYFADDPQGMPPDEEQPAEPGYVVDGYLPEGSPDYFGDERWPNPETDPRFEFISEGNEGRSYGADLDGDGTDDYQIRVTEFADGTVWVHYFNVDSGEAEMRVVVTQDAAGNYTGYEHFSELQDEEPQGVPPANGLIGEPDQDDYAPDGYLPDNAPDYFGDPMWTNPETDARFEFQYEGHPEGEGGPVTRTYIADVDGDGATDFFVVVMEYPDGNVYIDYQYRDPDDDQYLYHSQARVHVTSNDFGNYDAYEISYLVDEPHGVPPLNGSIAPPADDEPEFEADGYLPDGSPDSFGEGIWVNPETDPRFEFYIEGHPGPGVVTRVYRADLDGDGTHDYQIVVVEYAVDGSTYLDYHNMETDETEARVNVTQDAYGNYNGYFELHRYVDDPQGVLPYDGQEPEDGEAPEEQYVVGPEEAIYDAIPDNLPLYFEEERFPNPEQSGDYHYDFSEGDVHYFMNEEGTQSIRVWTNPNGNVTMAWHDAPPSQISASTQELVVEIQADGAWETTYYSDAPPATDSDAATEGPEFEEDAYLPEGAPAYFGDERWPNPEQDERFEWVTTGRSSDGATLERQYRADLDGDGQHDYSVFVAESADGSVSVRYLSLREPVFEAHIDVTQDVYGNYVGYETEYLVDDPHGAVYEPEPEPEEPEFAADGYLPEGAPAYFIDERWPNPETDERFEFQYESHPQDGVTVRFYHVDLDGDGAYDYRAVVIENPDGTLYVDYGDLSGNNEARIEVTQDANGYYGAADPTYYVDDPQGAVYEPETIAAPVPEDDHLPDWLPNSFDGWPSPTQEGFEYQYTGTGDGYENHFYSNGQYTIMVTDYGDGTGRVLIDDTSTGAGWDTGYDLYGYGQYSVMDAYVPEEPEPEPEDERLPDWLPESFDGWPSPTQEGFEYQYTGQGVNHFYSNGQYTIMVTDYGDGTGRVLIDDLGTGQGWDTGYDLYDYGSYQVMDEYAPEAVEQIAYVQLEPEDLDGEAPEGAEPEPEPADDVQAGGIDFTPQVQEVLEEVPAPEPLEDVGGGEAETDEQLSEQPLAADQLDAPGEELAGTGQLEDIEDPLLDEDPDDGTGL